MNIAHFFKRIKLEDVFTPNSIARLSYVSRLEIESDLKKYLNITGKQIIIYGHSGSGKTTLLRNILQITKCNFIKVHCQGDTTFNDIILQAFDSLNVFYVREIRASDKYTISSSLKAEYNSLSSSIAVSNTREIGNTAERIVPPQLTTQKLAQLLGEVNSVLIIEDFHKVAIEDKKKIADIAKIFIDESSDYPKVKIICIGAVGTARELVEFDSNLNSRVAEISVPLLSEDEIKLIVEKGCKLLNVKMENQLVDSIVYYSNNIGSLAHQMCYDICYENNIRNKSWRKYKLDSCDLKYAIESFVKRNSDTFTKLYDQIISSHQCGWYILRTFNALEKESLSLNEIQTGIPHNLSITIEQLVEFLEKLSTTDYDNLVRFDINSQKYSISTPFFRAFLKMKFELERYEKEASKQKRRKKQRKQFHIKPSYEFDYNDEFMTEYIKVLSHISKTKISFKVEE